MFGRRSVSVKPVRPATAKNRDSINIGFTKSNEGYPTDITFSKQKDYKKETSPGGDSRKVLFSTVTDNLDL